MIVEILIAKQSLFRCDMIFISGKTRGMRERCLPAIYEGTSYYRRVNYQLTGPQQSNNQDNSWSMLAELSVSISIDVE